ncbi:hypothetical protein BCR44DRAFT_60031 [Catenaria anguillulae PL171]|uniref:Uncharacterized protein n=1 Tax=Catenaria anguillulae PL171 TaxID=765915 RepID=A0A1Y2HUM1_9FUNG|nr:hypothetical protein BCR44DRAFT_60031 [Catenaria anguillulae PL171]
MKSPQIEKEGGGGTSVLSSLPISVLKRIAVHARFNHSLHDDDTDPARAQASLAAFALTCKHVSSSVMPVLYRAPVLNRIKALSLLTATLNDLPDLAARVKRIVAGPTFVDPTTFDCIGLIGSVKWQVGCGIPSPARFAQLGKNAPRTLLMAWLASIASKCPNLKAVDLSLATHLHSSQALGFNSLAAILRERGGSFQAPADQDWPVSCILASDPDHAPHHGVVYFVRAIDYGNRTLDIFNTNWPGKLAQYNLHPIQDLIPDGHLRHWHIRHIDLVHQYEVDPFAAFMDNLPAPPLETLGLSLDSSYIFDLSRQVLPGSQSTVSLWTVHLAAASDILSRRHFSLKQCTKLQLKFPAPTALEAAHPEMYGMLMSDLFQESSKALDRDESWPAVKSLTLAAPYFTQATSLDSLHALAKLADKFPNVTSLTIESSYTSLADILLWLDPFVRRPQCPLQALTIVRDSLHESEPELDEPPAPTHAFTPLVADQRNPGHLHTLVLVDRDTESMDDIAIHPGLLYGLERLNVRGVDLVVAAADLATLGSPSFPSLTYVDDATLLEAHLLPHLRSLGFNAGRALDAAQDDDQIDNLDQLLPEAPALESLVVDVGDQEYFTRVGFVLDVLDKYARTLRNVYITRAHLSDAQIDKLGGMLAQRAGGDHGDLRIARLLIGNHPDSLGQPRLLAMGERATTWVSDVLVPLPSAEQIDSALVCAPSTLAGHAGFAGAEQRVQTKGMSPGKRCACGKRGMGQKPSDLGTHVWCSVKELVVVCEACVQDVEGSVKVWESESGSAWTMREVRHLNGAQDVHGIIGHGVWGLGDGRVLTDELALPTA